MFPSAFLSAVQYPQSFACQLFPTAAFSIKSNLMMQFAKDKGGMIFSPRVGLHENVAVFDYENEYANLIITHNLSYERTPQSNVLLPIRHVSWAEVVRFLSFFVLRTNMCGNRASTRN